MPSIAHSVARWAMPRMGFASPRRRSPEREIGHRFDLHVAVLELPLDGMDHPLLERGVGLEPSHQPKGASMSGVVTIGLDLAKSIFQIHGADDAGRMMLRRRLSRHELVPYFAKISPCLIGMEACSAAHHWARELSRFGHSVRLIPPQYAKPYVKRNKTDAADAEAICEAVARPNMRWTRAACNSAACGTRTRRWLWRKAAPQ
jgi:hypothetical protein